MSIEPIELWLDVRALRRGLIYPIDPDSDPTALCIQDSGMVPVATRIAVVNPETCQLCRVGEFGEIWVQSEACAKAFYMSKSPFDQERFGGRLVGGDPNNTYVRTGDLGFLHNVTRPIGPGNQPVEMQILFVLGSIGDTFEVHGLNHFPIDIENSVEKCHRNITPGGCAVFQAGGMVVVLVEVFRKAYLASIVPVIVNAVLNEHQIVVDIVGFIGEGDFPRSRLSEKQRGKILASWVTRKLRTIAQFGIRDAEGPDGQDPGLSADRRRTSMAGKSVSASQQDQSRASMASETQLIPGQFEKMSTRSSIMPELPLSLPPNHYQIDPTGMYEQPMPRQDKQAPAVALNDRPYSLPEGVVEMPTNFQDIEEVDNPYLTDEKFFDPNADWDRQFDEDNDLTPGGPPRLSLVNPDNYSSNGSNENTPTSYTATATPTSTHRAMNASEEHADESPYEDQGNPFRNSIPASVPSFDFVTSPTGRNPAREQMANASAAYSQITSTTGRALLPSQQARYPNYQQEAPRSRHVSENSYEAKDLPEEAMLYASAYGRQPSGNYQQQQQQQGATLRAPGQGSGDLSSVSGSVSGSVRRRYDGSGYDDYEY